MRRMGFTEERALEEGFVMGTYGRKPVEFTHGCGMTVYDDAGNAYLDFIGGIGAVSLGHCHPAVVSAVQKQAKRLIHVSNYYYVEGRGKLAETLSGLLDARVSEDKRTGWKTFFANSGAEANECALKIARLVARRRAEASGGRAENVPRLVVTLDASFHGRTYATLAATAQPAKQEAFQPLPAGFTSTPINDIPALEALFAERGSEICAVMVECVQGESGVHPCTAEFLAAVRRLTEACGALLICDEVQCGIYRCGTYPFGFQHFGLTPDVVTIAKGVASGFPTGMCAARAGVADVMVPGDHGSTFGGSCLAVAAASATLAALAEQDAAFHVEEVGAYLRARLSELSHLAEVRGLGLMVAADLAADAPRSAPEIVDRALEEGLLLNATGPRTLRFLPPLICSTHEIDALIEKLAVLL